MKLKLSLFTGHIITCHSRNIYCLPKPVRHSSVCGK